MFRMLATVVGVDGNNHPVILLDGAEEGNEATALRAGSYIPREGDRCVVTKLGMRFVAEYAIDGEIGAGLSAYEIAVQHGFTGTEAEWLESLKGAPGAPGAPGANGLSAYQVAVANGFTGTEAEWLGSLVGPPGVAFSAGRFAPAVNDFLSHSPNSMAPFGLTTMNGGTVYAGDGDANHIGVIEIAGGTSSGGGARIGSVANAMSIAGGEKCEIVFKMLQLNANPWIKFGFHSSEAKTEITYDNGVMIRIQNSTLKGTVLSAGVQYNTETTYTLERLVWYRAALQVNADATEVAFQLYAEDGTLLWSDSVVRNLADGALVGMILNATYDTTTRFVAVDRIAFDIDRDLVR